MTHLANLRPVEVANLSESVRRNRRQLPIGLLEYTVSPARAPSTIAAAVAAAVQKSRKKKRCEAKM